MQTTRHYYYYLEGPADHVADLRGNLSHYQFQLRCPPRRKLVPVPHIVFSLQREAVDRRPSLTRVRQRFRRPIVDQVLPIVRRRPVRLAVRYSEKFHGTRGRTGLDHSVRRQLGIYWENRLVMDRRSHRVGARLQQELDWLPLTLETERRLVSPRLPVREIFSERDYGTFCLGLNAAGWLAGRDTIEGLHLTNIRVDPPDLLPPAIFRQDAIERQIDKMSESLYLYPPNPLGLKDE